jgi:hypothetical protein
MKFITSSIYAVQIIIVISLVVNLLMALSPNERAIYMFCIGSVILLVGMHLASKSSLMKLAQRDTYTL